MNNIQIGNFINTNYSNFPSLVISKNINNNTFLITIHEYNGDYKIINDNEIINTVELNIEEKLSLLSYYGNWFYECHKNLFQELIILCIN